ncbi:septal ring lytic transglycosylase RlpA family protein [Uliginosibacterium sp. H1]|uniref:septal ring lytic transglycosylase RlpA family protein n=1 Tax=Uliginosibacterium sp. H1 TaxID=3114757 RepID=UPI002E194680|nr:septal ring lytic transglycosylase RlpA family protein [Uliginosibacterium sp. H1]
MPVLPLSLLSLRTPSRLLPLVLSLLLAACASTSQPPVAPTAPATRTDAPTPQPAPTGGKGGGYYMDDGPGSNPPPDLAAIPDAEPRSEPLHRFANRPYSALGQTFTPMVEIAPYRAEGIASWYGRRFHGKKTSSGEVYDMYAMTAAHPTLPIPSYARVTLLSNGRSVVVRINDRGPFLRSRLIDLSYAAAWKLGYIDNGHAEVIVETIIPGEVTVLAKNIPPIRKPDPSPPPPVPAMVVLTESANAQAHEAAITAMPPEALSPGTYLQLGAFGTLRNAESFRDYVRQEVRDLNVPLHVVSESDRHRLQAGPYGTAQAAQADAAAIARKLKLKPLVVQR